MGESVLEQVAALLTEHFGQQPQRASISFVGVEPIEVLRFMPEADERVFTSLGMSRHPMTDAGEIVQAADGPRAELMLRLRDPTDAYADLWRRLALLAAAPTVEGVVYAEGMTVDLGEPLTAGTACRGVLIRPAPLGPIRTDLGEIAILETVPVTSTEIAWCRVRGAEQLTERWSQAGTDLLDLARHPVRLD